MMKFRFSLTLNCLLLISLILTSCGGAPQLPGFTSPTPTVESSTASQQTSPPALIETDPPLNSVIGHQSPITFYFNQPMNKPSVESALSGLPEGAFTWKDEATLVFTPTQPYPSNTKLNVLMAASIQSGTGFGVSAPIELSFTVADYLRGTNLLPKANTTDVNVEAAIAISFNQPVVALGVDASSLPSAFNIQPAVSGRGEWINTSTYVFYPETSMQGGTEYTVSVDENLRSVTGVGLDRSVPNAWKFVTSRPRVVTLEPSSEGLLPLDPKIKLTFNQPMDRQSTESNFVFSGAEGAVTGEFAWNVDSTELTFTPGGLLARNIGYRLNLDAAARSQGGMTLETDYGAVLRTYDNFAVTGTTPNYGSATFTFNSPLVAGNYDDSVKVTPAVDNLVVDVDMDRLHLYIYGDFVPGTDYIVELSAQIKDEWGQPLGDPFVLNYETPPLPPSLDVNFGYNSIEDYTGIVFVRPDDPVVYANATNIKNVDVEVASVTLQDYLLSTGRNPNYQPYTPSELRLYPQTLNLLSNKKQQVKLPIAQQNTSLVPGLYYISLSSPQLNKPEGYGFFAVASHVNLTFKVGATETIVWAVDLPSQTPVANAPIAIYDVAGNQIASGSTDENGLWKGSLREVLDYGYAVLGQPGDDIFSIAINRWKIPMNEWGFGYYQRVEPPHTEIYMYTDRPIYRPGQTIYYRGVVRQAFNGRYEMPPINTVPIILSDGNGTQLATVNAQLSPFGTFNGQFDLPQNALPGYYSFSNPSLEFYLSLQVAEYRKPEIDLTIALSSDEIKLGGPARANVNARYFFGAPAADVNVHWALYTKPDTFSLPNYQTGLIDDAWLDVFRFSGGDNPAYFGIQIEDGTGQTTPEGILTIDLPAIPETDSPQLLTLEATATDETGLPVSTRTEIRVHPADFYIGLHPDQWVGTAKSDIGFDVYTADWSGEPSGDKALVAEFKQVRWEKETDEAGYPTYTPVYTPVGSSNFATGPDGRARLSFVPPASGTYMLDVSGGNAHTQTLIWVGGAGTAAWPDLPNQRLELTADKDSYKAGDTANVFIPNPFATNSLALVTVERGLISNAEVIRLSGSGREYSLPITDEDAPNVYVSVTVLGQGNDFRQGLVNIPVMPDAQELRVRVSPNPPEAGPRDNVTFDVAVTDHQGQPVEGEFSLSVIDQSVLALADPNVEDILPAFYSNQPLGVETGLSLAAYGGRNALQPGGLGGGGGQDIPTVREDFPDTAYWNPSLITNSDGRGQVTMTLPDSLTTWQVDVRGLTLDTKVGQAETEIVSTKPLLIRPVTPRFLVSGDHVLMAAVVNNNTSNTLKVAVNIQGDGFVLDQPEAATRNFDISSHSQARVEWWGTAGLADSADLTFSVTTSGPPALQDSARPVWGSLPILQYTAPQAFVTGGVLRGAASQQEVISLPRTFAPGAGGGLDVELSPSLAGSLLFMLEAVDVPESSVSAEASVSYLLPNIEVHRALKNASLDDPTLTARVTMNLNASVSRLSYLQNADGGWSWWGTSEKSDPYISAYVFFGLLRARGVGAAVSDDVLNKAIKFLQESQPAITPNTKGAELDETTFIQFALSQAGVADPTIANALYDARDRMSPSSAALLAYTLKTINPAETRVRDLISNLESGAIRTASSAHWETPSENILTRGSSIYTTSLVVYILAQLDPANQIVFDAVRYLAAHRDARGLWSIGHENAWAMMALNEAMVGLGDLRSDFAFNAALNDNPLTSGDVAGIQLVPLTAQVPLEFLSPNSPNLLTIHREDGLGRLYYRAVLNVNRPVTDVKPLNNGMSIERVYLGGNCVSTSGSALRSTRECTPLSSIQLASGQPITAQLTLILPHDSYYVMVEDHISAGTEILNRALKTSQLGVDTSDVQVQFDEEDPFADGWGWWLFNEPQIRDEGILFTADYLPAETYVLTYTLIPLQAGEYHILPAHAWQAFFPEVQGTSAGAVFEVKP